MAYHNLKRVHKSIADENLNMRSMWNNPHDIQRTRNVCGLPPIKRGETQCLNCGDSFYSHDIKNNRTCERCKKELYF